MRSALDDNTVPCNVTVQHPISSHLQYSLEPWRIASLLCFHNWNIIFLPFLFWSCASGQDTLAAGCTDGRTSRQFVKFLACLNKMCMISTEKANILIPASTRIADIHAHISGTQKNIKQYKTECNTSYN